jgi:putative ABC transport system ATP-binding protein
MSELIEFRKVTKLYGQGEGAMQALAGVDFCINEGEFVAIMGPSGSGKSTCMNIVGCLDTPTGGAYLFKGVDVGKLSRHERKRRAMKALEVVGLAAWADHTPAQLSGGQQQRVAIARAIVTDPAVLLADEPTGNLDSARSREIMDLLTKLNREQGISVVMVTHEPDMAEYASRTIQFRDGLVASDTAKAA